MDPGFSLPATVCHLPPLMPRHAASPLLFMAVCFYCTTAAAFCLFPSFSVSHMLFPLFPCSDRLLLALAGLLRFFFLFLNLRFSLLLFVFLSFLTSPPPLLLSSLLWQLWPHPPSLCPPNPLLPPPPLLSPAPGCQTLPSRPRGKAKAVDFSPHQAF